MTDLRALLARAGEVLHRWSRFAPQPRCFCERCEQSRELRALHAEITAALADAPDDGWRDIMSSPKGDEEIEMRARWSDCAGSITRTLVFTHWRPLPPPPAERKE